MTITLSTEHRLARMESTRAFLDRGTQPARVRIYGGVRPAQPADTPPSGMLVEVRLTRPCGNVVGGQLVLTAMENALITASGLATWARLVNGEDVTAMDLDCSDLAGDGEIRFEQTQLYAGGYAQMANAVLA